MKFKTSSERGFTFVEMLVAVGLFTLIAAISLGAVISVFDASRRARSAKSATDNLNFVIENMTRTVRFGTTYHCGSTGTLTDPQNCNAGNNTFLAINFKGNTVIYRLNSSSIQRSDNGGVSYANITSSDMRIEVLRFYVFNSANTDTAQPYVIAVIKGFVGSNNRPTIQSRFSIATMMSQRKLDVPPAP